MPQSEVDLIEQAYATELVKIFVELYKDERDPGYNVPAERFKQKLKCLRRAKQQALLVLKEENNVSPEQTPG